MELWPRQLDVRMRDRIQDWNKLDDRILIWQAAMVGLLMSVCVLVAFSFSGCNQGGSV